jgi:hypothetical protein
MTTPSMPARGERAAPTFDRSKPRELCRFFEELEYLFVRTGLATEPEKKKQVLRYVDFEIEQTWKTFPEYADLAKTYDDFKKAILVHYPDATGDYVYSLRDLDSLVGERQRVGIHTTNELQDFHLSFLTITTWLIEKKQLGDLEQRRGYLRAFQQPFLASISNRLQMKFHDHHPNIPHKIEDVYEAARFILQSDTTNTQSYFAPLGKPAAADQPTFAKDSPVKVETFGSFMTEFTKSIVDALQQGNRARNTPSMTSNTRNTDCNFCGGPHYIRDCKVVDEYIVAGKCKRNTEGKVVLSTGGFVPRDIPGTLLRERVDEWHHRFPNQLSVATMVHTISMEHLRAAEETKPRVTFQLSTADRINTLEAELFNLRSRRPAFAPAARTRSQQTRELTTEASIEELEDVPVVRSKAPATFIPQSQKQPVVARQPEIVITALPPVEPEHPYSQAKDAAYAPVANEGSSVRTSIAKPIGPAYKTLPPVHEASIALDVYKRTMELPITITQRELLSLSPEVRAQVRDVTTTRRIPNTSATTQGSLQVIYEDDVTDFTDFDMTPAFVLETKVPPKGSLIVADPIESYYNSLEPGEEPDIDRLTVAKESTALRAIFALIDSCQRKECIVDPGCQVIAMSETACHSLALPYDPRIRLNMESANGTFDWSLGLARNVPFLLGTITIYLQVHVIRSPSYEILLGRPFDVLTGSVVRNFTNEDQTITITDPNSGAQCTIPTFARGTYSSKVSKKSDF